MTQSVEYVDAEGWWSRSSLRRGGGPWSGVQCWRVMTRPSSREGSGGGWGGGRGEVVGWAAASRGVDVRERRLLIRTGAYKAYYWQMACRWPSFRESVM